MVKEPWYKRIFRFSESEPAVVGSNQEKSFIVRHTNQIGSTGTESYAGYPAEEYLRQLTGTQRAKKFDEMRRGDPQIKMLLGAVKSPLKVATHEIMPYDENDADSVADAELVKHILFEGMEKPYKQFFSEFLSCIEFGHVVFEIQDSVNLNHPKFGSYNGIKNLAFRSQKTIECWNLNVETDGLASISQYAYGDLNRTVNIPAEFLLHFAIEQEGSNFEGVSMIRSCYGNWVRKNNYLKINAIGVEKHAVPTPIVEVPANRGQDEFDNMVSALENYQVHENNYLMHPVGWKITLNSNAYDPQKVETSIDNEDKRMTKAFLANFLELGMNGFGTGALSFDLSDFFLSSIEYIANDIYAENMNKVLIPRIVQMNRGPRSGYPKLKVSGISDKAGKELADTIVGLAGVNALTPDDVLEKHLRKRIGLPDMSDQGKRQQPVSVAPKFSETVRRLRSRNV